MSKLIVLLFTVVSVFASEAGELAGILLSKSTLTAADRVVPTRKALGLSSAISDALLGGDLPPLKSLLPMPLRRQERLINSNAIHCVINYSFLFSLDYQLITMIQYVDTNGITDEQIIKLIKANPGKSNPYSGSHQAHLIALSCRIGRINIISAVLESNPEALNCDNSGCIPLEEAVAFYQPGTARFLREKGARKPKSLQKKRTRCKL